MTSRGYCRGCLSLLESIEAMAEHVKTCPYAHPTCSSSFNCVQNCSPVYTLQIKAVNSPHYLFIDILANSKLSTLDEALKSIWLDCCPHHKSLFDTLDGTIYSATPNMMGSEIYMADVTLAQVFQSLGDQAIYEYDSYQCPTILHISLILVNNNFFNVALKHDQFFIVARNGTTGITMSPREGVCKYKRGDSIDNWCPNKKRVTYNLGPSEEESKNFCAANNIELCNLNMSRKRQKT